MIGDDHGDDGQLFSRNGLATKGIKSYFQPRPLSEIFTIVDLRHVNILFWIKYPSEYSVQTADDNNRVTLQTF